MLSAPVLAAQGLCYAYAGEDVLHDVSVELRPGEVVAIAGPNGSGKSTLVELLAGVLKPRRGSVRCDAELALVVQRPDAPSALPLTAREVVAMGAWQRRRPMSRRDARHAVATALERVGVSELADHPLTSLSGGQRQRVLLAQGIVRAPDILLLDEPAAGFDRDSVARMHAILTEEAARGAAVATVTHDDATVSRADRVIRLDAGELVG